MTRLTDYTSYADAQAHASSEALWALFDGDREVLNIAHECMLRHADGSGRTAVRIAHADGADEILSFDQIAAGSARFAHWLRENGIQPGDRIAFMLEPSLPFYVCLFGAMMTGAISVPLFTLFGLDGLRLRVDDCQPALLITNAEKADIANQVDGLRVAVADAGLLEDIARFPTTFEISTRAGDLAVFQYTSGTTRELPAAVKHTHRSLVTLMFAALYGTGIRPGDEFFCPSSPAWGHGLWHGTLAPLALGVATGTFAGRFDPVRLMKALQDYRITNMSAAATHYRMMKNSGQAGNFRFAVEKLSYTGEPIDPQTLEFVERSRRVVWVEAGTHAVSRRLSMLRDMLRERFSIVAPCTHQERCGALVGEDQRDWCHFFASPPSWVFRDGDWVRLARRLGIDLRALPYAFVALRREDRAATARGARLLGRPKLGKVEARVHLCDGQGLHFVHVEKRRVPDLFRALRKHGPELRSLCVERDGDRVTDWHAEPR